METRENRLAAKVKAVNACHLAHNEWLEKLRQVFMPLVGQKILKADGTLLSSVAKLMPKLPNTVQLSIYRHTSNYSLAWTVKTCEDIDGSSGCLYYTTTFYVGELDGQVLSKIAEWDVLRYDYTVEEIELKRFHLKKCKEAVSQAEYALGPFQYADN